tara:strand:+ start:1364 stop:2593 length:1230 start_codon:yes stop_codon:yes gene_type:complete
VSGHSESTTHWAILQRSWAGIALVLFAVTYKVWLPPNQFPAVPLLDVFGSSAAQATWIHYLLLTVCSLALLGTTIKPASTTWFIVIVSLLAMFLLNQHRLQPWAFHLLLGAFVFAACSIRQGTSLLRLLTISIYTFSAAGKFDYQFMETVGQEFLVATTGLINLNSTQWDPSLSSKATLLFPLAEILVAVLLIRPRSRKAGIALAILLHLSIITLLSPLGLGHKPGVIIWNGLFVVLVPLLFSDKLNSTQPAETTFSGQLAAILVLAASLLPAVEPLGKYDHWLAWGLYSPRTSRVIINVHLYDVGVVEELEAFMLPQLGDTPYRTLDLRKWSLATLNVPVYPQDRFQLAAARYIAHKYKLGDSIQVHMLSISDRFTGHRTAEILNGTSELDMHCRQFFFSTTPVGLQP